MIRILLILCLCAPVLAYQLPGNEEDWLLFGIDLGLQEKTEVNLPEVSNRGPSLGLKGAYTNYNDKSVWDIGFGIRFDRMEQNSINVHTTTLLSELGWRYRFTPKISFGPELHLLIGKDVSFSDTGTNSDDRPTSAFAGLRLSYDTVKQENSGQRSLWRFAFRTMVDLDIKDRKVAYHQVLAEYAWPVRQAKAAVGLKKEPTLKFDLRAANIQFVTGSTELTPDSYKIVNQLGRILNQFQPEWEYISLSGHTDLRGDYTQNVKLSWDRAQAIRKALTTAGVPDQKIDTKGYGPDRPLIDQTTPEAYQANRRVELELNAEEASPQFVEDLKTLFKKQ